MTQPKQVDLYSLLDKISRLTLEGKINTSNVNKIVELVDECERPNGSQVLNEHMSGLHKSRTKAELYTDTYARVEPEKYKDNDPRFMCTLSVYKTEELYYAQGKSKAEALNRCCDQYLLDHSKDIPSHLKKRHNLTIRSMTAESGVATMGVSTANDTATISGSRPVPIVHASEIMSLDEFTKYSTDPTFNPHTLTDRWILLDQFTWTEAVLGSEVGAGTTRIYDLPRAITANAATACDSLSLLNFRVNRLCKTGFEVRVDCPANPLSTGQIATKFLYEYRMDRDGQSRISNNYTMTHGTFGKVRPGGVESSLTRVEFNNRNACVSNQKSDFDDEGVLYIGSLILRAINPLRVAPTVTNKATVRLMFRFIDTELHGRKPGGILKFPKDTTSWKAETGGIIGDIVNSAPMQPVVGTLHDIDQMIGAVRRTNDQDMPPDPFSKMVVIPSFTNHMSYATGITENTNSLRMVAGGQLPKAVVSESEAPLSYIMSDEALYKQATWSVSDAAGAILYKIPIEAFHTQESGVYPTVNFTGGTGLAVPPMDIVASNFTYFSGKIRYKVEVVCTDKHNGALKVAAFPLLDISEVPESATTLYSLNDVKAETITLGQLNSTATVEADYHNLNTIIGIRSGDEFSTTPRRSMGVLIVSIHNPLESSVASTTVDVNLYKCAVNGAEVMISKNSVLLPAYDAPDGYNPAEFMIAVSGNKDFYYQRSTQPLFPHHVILLQYSSIYDSPESFKRREGSNTEWAVAQVLLRAQGGTPVEKRFVITADSENEYFEIVALDPGKKYNALRWAKVVLFPNGFGGYHATLLPISYREGTTGNFILMPETYFTGFTAALNELKLGYTPERMLAVTRYCAVSTIKSKWLSDMGNMPNSDVILEFKGQTLDNYYPPPITQLNAESDNPNSAVEEVTIKTGKTANHGFGGLNFGEGVVNLKTLLRQPRYLASIKYTPSKDPQWPYALASVRARHFQPPVDMTDLVDHHSRWSKQMVLLSGYTYARGGISYIIMVPPLEGTLGYVQSVPHDRPPNNLTLVKHTGSSGPLFLNGLNFNVVNTKLNSHITEVFPDFKENTLNLLMRMPVKAGSTETSIVDKSVKQCYDLGTLRLGFFNHSANVDNSTYTILIFTKWADDTEVSCYRGFPPMRYVSDVNAEGPTWALSSKARNKLVHASNGNSLSKIISGFTNKAVGNVLQSEQVVAQLKGVKEEITNGINMDREEMEKKLTTHMQSLIDQLQQTTNESVMQRLGEILAGQALHFFRDPTIKTAIVCIASTLFQASFFGFKVLHGFIKSVNQILSPEQPDEGSGEGLNGETDGISTNKGSVMKSIIAVLVSGICSKLAWSHPSLDHIDWIKKLTFAIPSFAGMGVSIYKFMDLIFPVLEWLYRYICELKVRFCDGKFEYYMMKSENFITSWVSEVDTLTSPKFREQLDCVESHNRVSIAHAIGKAIEKMCLTKRMNGSNVILKRVANIDTMYNTLSVNGLKAVARQEPYAIWMYGESGIGKSHIVDSIETELLRRNSISFDGEKTLIVQPTSKYLNRCDGQPCCRVDDFGAVISPEFLATQLSYIYEGVTSAAWCPNQADLSDKNKLYAPTVMTFCSNMVVPCDIQSFVADMSAFLRRRNCTLHVVKNEAHFSAMSQVDKDRCKIHFEQGKKLGHLPPDLKKGKADFYTEDAVESPNNHIRIKFMEIPENYPLGSVKVRKIEGKTMFTVEQAIDLINEDFKEFRTNSLTSFNTRIANHYAAKNQILPDFTKLLDESNDAELGILIRNSIAKYEGDGLMMEVTRKALEQVGISGHGKYLPILKKYYNLMGSILESFRPESKINPQDDYTEEKFLKKFPSQVEQVKSMLAELKTKGKITYGKMCEFQLNTGTPENPVYGERWPLVYEMLKLNTHCRHKITGNATKDFDNFVDLAGCTSSCIMRSDFIAEVLESCIVQMEGDTMPYFTKMRTALAKVPTTVKQYIAQFSTGFKDMIKVVMSKVNILGISLWKFLKQHWKPVVAAIGVATSIWFARRSPSIPGTKYIINATDKVGEYATDSYEMLSGAVTGIADKARRYIWKNDRLVHDPESSYNQKNRIIVRTHKGTAKLAPAPSNLTGETNSVVRTIGGRDINTYRNQYRILICQMNEQYQAAGGIDIYRLPVFAIGGYDVIAVRHGWEIIEKYAVKIEVEVHRVGTSSFVKELKLEDMTVSFPEHYSLLGDVKKTGNFVMITLPNWFPPAKSLIRTKPVCGMIPCLDNCGRVVRSSAFQDNNTKTNSGYATLLVPPSLDENGNSFMESYPKLEYTALDEVLMVNPLVVGDMEVSTRTYYADNYMYDVHGEGFCTGILIDEGSGKIVGMHYAGKNGRGAAERLSTEMFATGIYEFDEPEYDPVDDSFDVTPAAIYPIGLSPEAKHQPSKSTIIESVIHGAVPITTGRAALCPQDLVAMGRESSSPLYNGVLKHGMPPKDFDSKLVDIADHNYRSVIMAIKPTMKNEDGTVRTPTIHEAIFGLEGVYNSMDLTTSLGHGWSKYTTKGKKSVVDMEAKTIDQILIDKVVTALLQIKNREVPFVIAEDCLKDETLKLEKMHNTRIISSLPFEIQILLRVYTMEFVRSHQKHNFESEHAIGINTDSDEVHMLVTSISNMNIIAGDFSNFGPGASAQVAQRCLQIIVDWYRLHGASEVFCQECETILQVLVCTPHLAFNKVYRTVCGIISGSAITVVLNTMIHSMYMRLAALGMNITMEEYSNNVKLYTYGDDGLAGVTDYLIPRFNMETLKQYFASMDIKYTNPDKTDEVVKTVPLITTNDVIGTSFLKHRFRLVGGKYIACLEKQSIENQINWISSKGDALENTTVNVQNALRQAYMHGKKYYDELENKCAKAFARKGRKVVLPNFAEASLARELDGLTTY